MKMDPVGTLSWTLKEKNYSVKKKKKRKEIKRQRKQCIEQIERVIYK